jgi:hypothetical protein
MRRYERAVVASRKHENIIEGIINGLEKNKRMKYTKPHDKAVGIIVSLEEAGFKIVRTPKVDGLTPGLNLEKASRMKW